MIQFRNLCGYQHINIGFIFFVVLLCLGQIALASPVTISEDISRYSIGQQLSVLEDANGTFSIQDMVKGSATHQFTPLQAHNANFGYSDSTYWFRFQLHNTTNEHRKLLLEVGYPLLDDIRFYAVTDANSKYKPDSTLESVITSEIQAGDLQPFNQRQFNYQNIVFKLDVKPLEEKTIYLRVKSESSVQVPLTLWDPLALAEHINKKQLGLGLYYGTMLVMVLYNLFLFISIRDRVYFFYVTYIASFIATQMALNGLAYEYLWPDSPTIANQSISFLVLLVNLTATLFWRSFLNLKRHSPRLYNVTNILVAVAVIGIFLALFLRYSITIRYSVTLTLINCMMGIWAGFYCWRLKVPTANYYTIAWLLFLVGSIVKSLTVLGFLPVVFFTEYAQQIGSSLEVILLSLGLADRINHLKRDARDKQERYLQLKIKSTEEEISSRQAMLEGV